MSTYSNFENDDVYRQEKARKAQKKFKPIKNNFFVVFGLIFFSALLGFLSFSFIYWCLLSINIHYTLKSLMACIFACFLLLLITPDTDFKTKVRKTSRRFVFVAAIISVLIGFEDYGSMILNNYLSSPRTNIYATDSATLVTRWANITTVEFGTLKQKGDEWSTNKKFPIGSSAIIKVSGHNVRFVGFCILTPGIYEKIISKDNEGEKLTFEGISDNTSVVSVSY